MFFHRNSEQKEENTLYFLARNWESSDSCLRKIKSLLRASLLMDPLLL